jgi:15,16-dihydrobiliverdin:ferredoxin oxidoreductase
VATQPNVKIAAAAAAQKQQQHPEQQQQQQQFDSPLSWTQSIAGPEHPLSYMPFLDWSLSTLAEQFQLSPTPLEEDMALMSSINPSKPGRIMSLAFTSPEIRKVRMTYFDAGPAVQVFNMVIYPDPSLDVPMLGVDLISFGKKNLAGIDFQPLFTPEAQPGYAERYIAQLGPIKAKYPDLSQQMSARFYDVARFFSEHMLFARYEDPSMISERLFPAFSEYLSAYVDTLKGAARTDDPAFRSAVIDRQQAYDQYNAERDPAHGLFVNYFGDAWSEKFMDSFLFELSERPVGGYKPQHQLAQQQQGPPPATTTTPPSA